MTSSQPSDRVKEYNRTKLLLGLLSSLLTAGLMVFLIATGLSSAIARWCESIVTHPYGALLLFACALGVLLAALSLPLGFYSGYVIEHRYELSNQTVGRWAWERLKGFLVSAPIAAGGIVLLYYCVTRYGDFWWLPVGAAVTVFSVVLARLAPVLLLPLFYRFTPLEEGSLKERIAALCNRAGVLFRGIYSFNLSKNTKKANAGFTGIGRARRIILGDTLLKEFTDEEIETVFAHELGHYRHRHILIGMAIGTISTFVGLYVAAQGYAWSLPLGSFSDITDIAALPLLSLWLSLFGLVTMPLGNMLSRRHERQADAYAVRTTGNATAFASALRKLAAQNLADPEPHPLVEFLFYSHPAIGRRLKSVEGGTTQ